VRRDGPDELRRAGRSGVDRQGKDRAAEPGGLTRR